MGTTLRRLHLPRCFGTALFAGLLVGCANGHCRGNRHADEKHVYVYKPDGSKQCSSVKGASVESMATELSSVQIYSEENRFDGKMHAQVCGFPTGRINVYEIGVSDLVKAQNAGFQILTGAK